MHRGQVRPVSRLCDLTLKRVELLEMSLAGGAEYGLIYGHSPLISS